MQAKNGDTVKVHYTCRFEDGTIFDTSIDSDPLEFTIGEGQLIPGFEEAVIWMNVGESKTTIVPAEKAFGQYREEMVMAIDRNQLPLYLKPKVGQILQTHQADGQTLVVRVTEVSESSVTLDANHPLAGKDLNFDIQLIEII